jgi:hypothetical protein
MQRLDKMFSIGALTLAALLVLPPCSIRAQSAAEGAGAAAPANASPPGNEAAPAAADSKAPDDATLKQTALAFVKVRQIAQNEQSAAEKAPATAEKQKAVQQGESEKLAAVKAQGLQPEEYNHVIMLVQADTNLRQRFMSYVSQAATSNNTD